MLTENDVWKLQAESLLAEVVGFETDEVVRHALGSIVTTYRGTRFIDFTGGIAVHACGHGHPEIVAAIVEQAASVLHISDIMRHTPQLELAHWIGDLLKRQLPGTDWQFQFMNSGSESIDTAAKLALKATGRRKFVAFDGAFHGRTLFASALSRSKYAHWDAYEEFLAPLRASIFHVPNFSPAGAPRRQDSMDALEQLLEQEGSNIAAVFTEGQQGEGGYVPMAREAGQRLRTLTREHGILLISDEIQSGFGRTGKWFAFEHLGIDPDMIVFGKAVGGGLPLAGVAARRALMESWKLGEHGTTFGGNPVSCAAGLAALKIIERDNLVSQADYHGDHIKRKLEPLIGQHGVVDVRGNGLMIGVELQTSDGLPDYVRAERVKTAARKQGLLFLTCGANIGKPDVDNSTIRLIPALNTHEEVIDEGLRIFIEALESE